MCRAGLTHESFSTSSALRPASSFFFDAIPLQQRALGPAAQKRVYTVGPSPPVPSAPLVQSGAPRSTAPRPATQAGEAKAATLARALRSTTTVPGCNRPPPCRGTLSWGSLPASLKKGGRGVSRTLRALPSWAAAPLQRAQWLPAPFSFWTQRARSSSAETTAATSPGRMLKSAWGAFFARSICSGARRAFPLPPPLRGLTLHPQTPSPAPAPSPPPGFPCACRRAATR